MQDASSASLDDISSQYSATTDVVDAGIAVMEAFSSAEDSLEAIGVSIDCFCGIWCSVSDQSLKNTRSKLSTMFVFEDSWDVRAPFVIWFLI